jgi:hypothetical protein
VGFRRGNEIKSFTLTKDSVTGLGTQFNYLIYSERVCDSKHIIYMSHIGLAVGDDVVGDEVGICVVGFPVGDAEL